MKLELKKIMSNVSWKVQYLIKVLDKKKKSKIILIIFMKKEII